MEDNHESQEALNQEPEQVEAPQQSPTVETQPDAQESQETHEEQPEERKPNRAQRRITDLSHQLREAREREEQLRAQMDANQFFSQTNQQGDPWQEYEDGNLTMEQLKQLVSQDAEFAAKKEAQALRQELAEKEYWRGMEADIRAMEAKNPRFNPASDEFDKEYVDELSSLYMEAYQHNLAKAPKLSTFVSRIEKLRARAEEQGVERSSAQLAEQASQGAVVGSGGAKPTKTNSLDALKEEAKQTGNWEAYFAAQHRAKNQ